MGTHAFLPKIQAAGQNSGLLNFQFDSFDVTAKDVNGPTEVKYYTGGVGGTLVATITITYDVDGDIDTVERT